MAQTLLSSMQPTDIYGGDEVSAIVLDPGYYQTRAGFAGEDGPKSVLPSSYMHYLEPIHDNFGDEYFIPQSNVEVRNYMSRESVVEDWDAAARIWEDMLLKRLQPRKPADPSKNGLNDDPKEEPDVEGDVAMRDADGRAEDEEKPLAENPLLITEANWNSPKSREKAIEIVMENWGCPAFWFSKTAVLAAFAAGKASALVIDVGHSNTSVTAIHDGIVLKRSIQKSHVGGRWLSAQVRSMWDSAEHKVEMKLRKFSFDLPESFREWEEERLVTEFKESVVEVWRGPGKYTTTGNEEYAKSQPGRVFEMPDGSNQMWREQRFRASEGMWDEAAAFPTSEELRVSKAQTIPELVRAAVAGVDVDLRPNLLQNVVVTGGTSLLNGFNDRLTNELTTMYPGMKIKINSAGLTSERRFGAWIGGSILASLGTFHQMWISRKEYEENGPGVVEKRCK